MRSLLVLTAVVFLVAMSDARAQSCPANATKASFAIWPKGSIKTGQSVTGDHPCGRRLTCTGGVSAESQTRRCHWL